MKKILYVSLFLNVIAIGCIIFALMKIGSPRYLFYLIKYRGQGIVSLKKSKTDHLKTLPIKKEQIVMLGNSITAECEWSELLQNPNVLNRGVIADGTADVLNRLDDIIALQPSKIFFLIGINDLNYIPLSIITAQYEKIVQRLTSEIPNTQLYLESVLPIHNDLRRNGMKNEDIRSLNMAIKEIAQRYKLTYIDLYTEFQDESQALNSALSLDGIHLNGAGYLLFKKLIIPYVQNNE